MELDSIFSYNSELTLLSFSIYTNNIKYPKREKIEWMTTAHIKREKLLCLKWQCHPSLHSMWPQRCSNCFWSYLCNMKTHANIRKITFMSSIIYSNYDDFCLHPLHLYAICHIWCLFVCEIFATCVFVQTPTQLKSLRQERKFSL